MRVTVLELPAVWERPTLDRVERLLDAGSATDLVVLPEMSLSGYVSPARDFDATPFAEAIDGPTARLCEALAKNRGIHLCAPLALREGNKVYNAMILYGAEARFVYRKRHPWFPEEWAMPGPYEAPIVELNGLRITIAVCFDLWFLSHLEADLLLFPSAWVEQPDGRRARLQSLAKVANAWIANPNWGPGVVRVPGQGGSCIVSPDGSYVLAKSGRADLSIE